MKPADAGIADDGAPVPFLDLARMHAPIKEAVLTDFAALIDANAYINGPAVAEFESAFADYCGTARSVGAASGLDALRLILLAAGIERGDEVVVPANTFVATLESVTQAGGKPVLVDAREADWNIDPDATEAAFTERTRFVMPVHLYGQLADMRKLGAIAARRGVGLVEDACQAHGATRDGVRAGTGGSAAAFSFYPGKNLGAMGDAGAVVTDDDELADRIVALREHGQRRKYHHELEGWTARLDTIQAIVLGHKLPLLDGWNEERRAVAAGYLSELRGVGDLVLPPVAEDSDPVWHLFVVLTGDPEALAAHLRERGIATGRHYPEPPHLSAAYAWLGHRKGEFPVTERIAEQCLSLPIFPGMTEGEVARVCTAVGDYFRG
ncbi:MAG: hypothetical protein QOE36_1609 [Gaiellaceae bacterium]|nr:hypothetical protein [Gaiellaceae bacterium]